mgnify:CR=1 FL=1
MNAVLIVCLVLITVAVLVSAFFLIRTLIQVAKTGEQAELLLKRLNNEFSNIEAITNFLGKFLTKPVVRICSGVIGSILSWRIFRRKKECSTQEKG